MLPAGAVQHASRAALRGLTGSSSWPMTNMGMHASPAGLQLWSAATGPSAGPTAHAAPAPGFPAHAAAATAAAGTHGAAAAALPRGAPALGAWGTATSLASGTTHGHSSACSTRGGSPGMCRQGSACSSMVHARGFAAPSTQEEPRVLVVFGASGGIGGALVDLLTEQLPNAKLVLAGRDDQGLVALKERQQKRKGGQQGGAEVEVHAVDALEPGQVEKLMHGVLQRHKRVDAVASLVGDVRMDPAAMGTTAQGEGSSAQALDHLRSVVEANLYTSFNVLQAASKAMAASGGGSIVLTSAAVARTGVPGFEAMSAAKAGVEGLVRSAAATFARQGVRVNAIAPGLTRTGQTEDLTKGGKPASTSASMHPIKHVAEPRDIATALAFFMHPHTDFITGQILAVDGGLSTLTPQQRDR